MESAKTYKSVWVISPSESTRRNADFDSVVSLETHSLSLPGFNIFLIPHSSLLRRLLWILVFAISIGLCAFQISERVRYFLEYPVSTSFAITSKTSFRFPNVTLCLFNPHASNKFQRYFNGSYSMYDVYDLLRKGKTVDDLWEMSWEEVEDVIINCTYVKTSCMDAKYWTKDYTASGACLTLSINEDIPYLSSDSSINLLLRELSTNMSKVTDARNYIAWKIFLHNPYLNRNYGTFVQGMSIYHNIWARYRFWEKELKYVNTPVRPCVEPDIYSACMQLCFDEKFHLGKAICRLPFSVKYADSPPCTYEQFMGLYNYTLDRTFERIDNSECDCGRSCHDRSYDLKPDLRSGKDNNSVTVIILPGRPDVDSMVEARVYTYTSLIGDIGGTLGLYLGACILTFFEILNLIFQAVVRKIHRHTVVNDALHQ